jgi:LacI family transcriptional regulator
MELTEKSMSEVRRVGVITGLRENPYDDPVIKGMAQFIHARGAWKLLLHTTMQRSPGQLRKAALDGIIVKLPPGSPTLRAVRRLGIPVVDIMPDGACRGLPQVVPDDRRAGAAAAMHFLERGYRHFYCCRYPRTFQAKWSDDRAAGFAQVIEEAGYRAQYQEPDEQADWHNLGAPRRVRALAEWLRRIETPAAVFAVNDLRAENVLSACERAQRRVPEDLALVGVDNAMPFCELIEPPLSSVPLDQARAGYLAAELLDHLMSGGDPPKQRILVPPLPVVVRRSSDQLAIADPELSQALRFIWEHAAGRLDVAKVVKAVAISRRSLEMKFRKLLRRSAATEIWRVRVEKAKVLLRETDFSIRAVALRSGFRHPAHFSILFRRHSGMTPTQFRQQRQA